MIHSVFRLLHTLFACTNRGFAVPSFATSVDDVYAVSDKLEKAGCDFQKKPDEGR